MKRETLEGILQNAGELQVLVVGDFFLDYYVLIDPERDEVSIETGKTAYQVVEVYSSPGAAGTVVNNLSALGVGKIKAVGVIGEDGFGFELKRHLTEQKVNVEHLFQCPTRLTPTYLKPLRGTRAQNEEQNRIDFKNWTPLPRELEDQVIEALRAEAPKYHALIVADQVDQEGLGLVTERVRSALCQLGQDHPDLIILVDSRRNIGEYRHVAIKPNEFEAGRVLGLKTAAERPEESVRALSARTQRPVFLTVGDQGQWVCAEGEVRQIPAFPVTGPIDIVGAGDSTSAGIVLGLAAGASVWDAALLGNLVASITITKLGTTGTASPAELVARYEQWAELRAQE